MPSAGFKPEIPASNQPQTLAVDRSTNVIGLPNHKSIILAKLNKIQVGGNNHYGTSREIFLHVQHTVTCIFSTAQTTTTNYTVITVGL
jgi:hypothetical protein